MEGRENNSRWAKKDFPPFWLRVCIVRFSGVRSWGDHNLSNGDIIRTQGFLKGPRGAALRL